MAGALAAAVAVAVACTPAAPPAPTPAAPTAPGSAAPTQARSRAPTEAVTPAPTEPRAGAAGTRPPPALARVGVAAERMAELDAPTALAVRAGDDALYVAERAGRVRALRDGRPAGEPLLDISADVSVDVERGLLGLTFSVDGTRLYVSYTNAAGDSRLDAYRMDGDRLAAGSRRQLLAVEQPFANHNGGDVAVGPDGLLYYGLGDGGSAGDPQGNGQDPSTLLGALLRVDPGRGDPYAIPRGNPFARGDGGRPEVFAFGLRNPWRFSFDRGTGDLWIADVGQSGREEINRLPAGEGAGANLGWNLFEGTQPFAGGDREGLTFPVAEYPHTRGRCSVIGGYVYRGRAIPDLRGAYLYTDFCGGRLEALRLRRGRVVDAAFLPVEVAAPVSFGQDGDGELYVLSLDGPVYRLVPERRR